MSYYITIEGIDGSGKSTLARKIALRHAAELTTEPWDEHFTGKTVREALKQETAPMTDVFLFFADRAEHLEKKVKPTLDRGKMVVSDRGADSTFAYQTSRVDDTLNVDPFDWFEAIYRPWDLKPDLTIYLDVSVDTALERCDQDEKYENREFLTEVRENYERMNRRFDERFHRIDAEQDMFNVTHEAFNAIDGI